MPEHDGINVTEMLIGIKEDVAKISAKLEHLGDTDSKADQALELARKNGQDIKDLKSLFYKVTSVLVCMVGIPIFIFIAEKFL